MPSNSTISTHPATSLVQPNAYTFFLESKFLPNQCDADFLTLSPVLNKFCWEASLGTLSGIYCHLGLWSNTGSAIIVIFTQCHADLGGTYSQENMHMIADRRFSIFPFMLELLYIRQNRVLERVFHAILYYRLSAGRHEVQSYTCFAW